MIAFLRGILIDKQPMRIVIDVSGVGYEAAIPLSSFDKLPSVGVECRVLIVQAIREDAHLLFGFMSEAERSMFLTLTSISGIGPKIALSALSAMTVRDIKAAAIDGHVKRFTVISGVGKKLAERMVMELRHRLNAADALETLAAPNGAEGVSTDSRFADAILALCELGYSQDKARQMIQALVNKGVSASAGVEDILKAALATR